MAKTSPDKRPIDIFDLESLYRVQKDKPNPPTHVLCNHAKGICIPVGNTDWEQLGEEWIRAFQKILFYADEGRRLWRKAMDQGFDAAAIVDSVALGVGESYIDPKSGKRLSYRRRESLASLAQAKRLVKFLAGTKRTIKKIQDKFKAVNLERDGAVFVPSADWPLEMTEFEDSLTTTLDRITQLMEHYRPMAHGSRLLDTHEFFMSTVKHLRRAFKFSDGEIATLLSAGYGIAGQEPITPQELRERMKSAQAIYGLRGSTIEGTGDARTK